MKPWIRLAKLVAKHDPTTADREGPHYCFACGDAYRLGGGMDPSALCNPCAQEWAQTFARKALATVVQRRRKR